MPKKIDQLWADLQQYVDRIEESVTDRVASAVGFAVRQRMLQFISKGISPVEGAGRYAEYKNVTAQRQRKAANRTLRKLARQNAAIARNLRRQGTRGSVIKNYRASARFLRRASKRNLKKGYPYNTEEYRKGHKRPRPVNLWLTGDFLRALTFGWKQKGKKKLLQIGWEDPKEAIKEKGHREGAGGQPKRPALPTRTQKFNQTIQLDIMKILRDSVLQAAKSAKRN